MNHDVNIFCDPQIEKAKKYRVVDVEILNPS